MRNALVFCLVTGLVAAGLSGCGSSFGGGPVAPADWAQANLQPFPDNAGQTPRWMDIADNLYSSGFQGAYQYPASGVQLGYTTAQAPLQFTVTAGYHALKPSFCYQMKIEGPSQAWSGDPVGADFENSQFGRNGRWWCDTCNAALTDADIDSGAHNGHFVKGYLYFDFLVTAKDGSAQQTSPAANSYHVTWKTSQRTRGPNDGAVRSYVVAPKADRWAYTGKPAAKTVGLYGEWEPGRPPPGQVQLGSGFYEGVEFRLTEESFHSTKPKGGNWRTVMSASGLAFEIP
ncbi:MAG: hypothetical protein FJX74_18135 [Armatimonadetes bacterium]|nr:hypothetical protein [Armatimonadota bacterium]